MQDIRWKQRFSNYQKALLRLEEAVTLSQTRELSYLEKQGFIQVFEFTFELSWKTLKDFLLFLWKRSRPVRLERCFSPGIFTRHYQ